jgi:hypothetical protein
VIFASGRLSMIKSESGKGALMTDRARDAKVFFETVLQASMEGFILSFLCESKSIPLRNPLSESLHAWQSRSLDKGFLR